MNEFTKLLEELREARQIGKKELALRAKLSPSYITFLTRGDRTTPSEGAINALATALGVDAKMRAQLFEAAGYPSYKGITTKEDWGEVPNVDVFYGREKEQALLEGWIVKEHCQMVAVLGMGGIGKTMLAAKVADKIQDMFEYVFWRSLQNAPQLENLLKNCIQFLANQQLNKLPDDTDNLISLLIDYLRKHRCLLVLDNFETVMLSRSSMSGYKDGYKGYGTLLRNIGEIKHQSCLLLTSREKPREIPPLEGKILPVRSMQVTGMGEEEGRKLLEKDDLRGSDDVWKKFIDLYSGNPLALKLASEPIRDLFDREIEAFLAQNEAVVGDLSNLLDQQFNRLSDLEQNIIYWLAIEREPVSLNDLRDDIVPLVSMAELLEALKSLHRRSMVETSGTAHFYLQPVIMEYAIDRFVEQVIAQLSQENIESADDIKLLISHAMMKAQAQDDVRDTEIRLILQPVEERLHATLEKRGTEQKLKKILSLLRAARPRISGYAAGNILNLLVRLNADLQEYDFSDITVWQAYLQGVSLHNVNFARANLAKSVFTDTFGSIFSVALSSNGEWLAAGTANGEVRVWTTANATPLLSLRGHTEWVRAVAFSPCEDIIASGSEDQTVRLWDVHTAHCINVLRDHNSRVYSVAFSPDGSILASGSDDQTIRLWDVHTGECLKVLQEHSGRVYSVAFSPRGDVIASGSADQTIRLWSIDNGACLHTLSGHTNWVRSVAFSPNSNMIASGSADQTIRMWDADTGTHIRTLEGHSNRVWSVAFSPDGSTLASGSDDQTIRLWNAHTGECRKILYDSRVYSLAFSPNQKHSIIASGSDGQTVRLWDTNKGACIRTLQGHGSRIYSVAFHPDGDLLASGSEDRMVRLWDIRKETHRTLGGHSHWVWSVAFSPDGMLLASGSEDRTVRVWNVSNGESLQTLNGHANRVYSVAFSPDGKTLASSSGDQTVKVWEISSGKCLATLQGHSSRVYSVAFHPNGSMLASGGDDQTVKVWQISSAKCLRTLQGHTNRVRSVTFSPDGNRIVSSSDDKTIVVWESDSGRPLRVLKEHINWVWSVAFSPDGNVIASGSEDETVLLWNAHTGDCIRVLRGHGSMYSVAFHPHGSILASGSHDGNISLWNVQTGECLQTLRSDRPYEHMNITGVEGLPDSQKAMLKELGAIDNQP